MKITIIRGCLNSLSALSSLGTRCLRLMTGLLETCLNSLSALSSLGTKLSIIIHRGRHRLNSLSALSSLGTPKKDAECKYEYIIGLNSLSALSSLGTL